MYLSIRCLDVSIYKILRSIYLYIRTQKCCYPNLWLRKLSLTIKGQTILINFLLAAQLSFGAQIAALGHRRHKTREAKLWLGMCQTLELGAWLYWDTTDNWVPDCIETQQTIGCLIVLRHNRQLGAWLYWDTTETIGCLIVLRHNRDTLTLDQGNLSYRSSMYSCRHL